MGRPGVCFSRVLPAALRDADLRAQLVRQAQRLQPLGLASGSSGNLSVRVDGGALGGALGGMLITPSGIAYDTLQPADMVAVEFTGPGSARWNHPLDPSSEWLMHQAVYQARPEAAAVVHGHPTYATVLAIQRTGDYSADYALLPLADVAGTTRVMEDHFISESGTDVTDAFRLYLRPLLGSGMPDAYRLRPAPVAKVLGA